MLKPKNQNKILFFPGDYPFCYYYRGFLPGVYSGQMVLKDFIVMGKQMSSKIAVEKAKEADIIVFHRPKSEEQLSLMRVLKGMGKKVLFDNDDSYKLHDGIPLNKLQNQAQKDLAISFSQNLDKAIQLADGVIASTEVLAQEYSQINPNVCVLKNCIDPLDEFPCRVNTTGKFRVGFVGSVTTNEDYHHIKDQILRLDARGDVTLVVLGIKYQNGHVIDFMKEDYDFWQSIKNIEWHPYEPVNKVMFKMSELALDVALIPRADNYFNRCKSNLKFLEMSLLHIPVIAQGFSDGMSPYQGKDEKYMTVITDNTTWYDKVIDAKMNYKKYKDLAEEAHDYVLREYNIETYAPTWVETIYKLL